MACLTQACRKHNVMNEWLLEYNSLHFTWVQICVVFILGGNLKVYRNNQCLLEVSQFKIWNVILEIMKGELYCATENVTSVWNAFGCWTPLPAAIVVSDNLCSFIDKIFHMWAEYPIRFCNRVLSNPREASSWLVSCSVNRW